MGAEIANPVTTTLLLERLGDELDESAWREFDARFRGVLLATGRRLGLSEADAEEAAQESMLQAFRDYRSGRYDRSRGRLSSWLISIARHRIIDIQRRRGRGGGSFDETQSDTPDPGLVEQAFENAIQRRVFEDAWSWLCAHTRGREPAMRAFELTAIRGVPVSEAASQCGMSEEQVYVARSRVAARLRGVVERFDKAFRDGL